MERTKRNIRRIVKLINAKSHEERELLIKNFIRRKRDGWLEKNEPQAPHVDKDLLNALSVISAFPESEKRFESLVVIKNEFLNSLRRRRVHSNDWRVKAIEEIRKVFGQGRYQRRLRFLHEERRVFISLLTRTSVLEMSPDVLDQMAFAFGEWMEIWAYRLLAHQKEKKDQEEKNIEKAIKAEKIIKGRVDAPEHKEHWDNFSLSEALAMAKSLTGICFRSQIEAKITARKKARKLAALMDDYEEELIKSGVNTRVLEKWILIKRMVALPSYLSRRLPFSLEEHLHDNFSSGVKIDLNQEELVTIMIEKNGNHEDYLWRSFIQAASHFSGNRDIAIRFFPSRETIKENEGKIILLNKPLVAR